MRNVKCADCAEYKNEWCEKKMDSPYPDMLRDCEYYHEIDKDVVKVVRCKDCKNCGDNAGEPEPYFLYCFEWLSEVDENGYCYKAERKNEVDNG